MSTILLLTFIIIMSASAAVAWGEYVNGKDRDDDQG